jgi:hypothetical protein
MLVRGMKPINFLTAKAIGTDVPKGCRSCNNCKACNFRVRSLTWNEIQELKKIKKGLSLNTIKTRRTAAYPDKRDPSELQYHYAHAWACLDELEKHLRKTGSCITSSVILWNVDRGVFRQVSDEKKKPTLGPLIISVLVPILERTILERTILE